MPAAQSKTEFLTVFDKELAKLERLLDTMTPEQADWSDDDVSIKGLIAHRIHWLDLFWGWYDAGADGQAVQTPAPGVKWNQLKAYNAPIYASGQDQDWAVLKTRFLKTAASFRDRIDVLEDQELYTTHQYDWTNDWTLGRWAESSGPSHFRSAAKAIRKILKSRD